MGITAVEVRGILQAYKDGKRMRYGVDGLARNPFIGRPNGDHALGSKVEPVDTKFAENETVLWIRAKKEQVSMPINFIYPSMICFGDCTTISFTEAYLNYEFSKDNLTWNAFYPEVS